ncbi:MAG: prephenate dehydrogenase [Haloplasmataceae bacterium]|nr:prephenate dehydrogenase [Haloplasmataceae bacterium]
MSKVLVVKNSDKRIRYLIEYLKKTNIVIEIYDEITLINELKSDLYECLVLPIRGVSKEFIIDGTNIKLSEESLKLLSGKKLFTGLINPDLATSCSLYNINLITYMTDDFAIKNNYITVEGIIEAIVNNSEKAIYNADILVIGYGRLGQITANIMKNLKANVTVSARNEKDLVHAKISEFNTIHNDQVSHFIHKYDFIINTIPFRILDTSILKKIENTDILLIDVASEPFGLDHESVKSLNIKVLKLPGIPGKIAPLTAGYLIGEFINYINLGGVSCE